MPMDIDVDRYQIEYRVKVDQSDWVAVMVDGTLTSYEIIGLSPLTTYEVRIFVISTEGVSSIAADAISINTKGSYCWCECIRMYVCVWKYCILMIVFSKSNQIITLTYIIYFNAPPANSYTNELLMHSAITRLR